MSQSTNPYTGKPYSAAYHVMRKQAEALSVSKSMPELLQAIRDNKVTIIVGETGLGKSTQTPQRILQDLPDVVGDKKICLTQPRRLAAQSVAERIAAEMDVTLGDTVGLKYRGVNWTNKKTRIEVNTDGTTVAQAKGDPQLSMFSVVVVDEAHQHSLPSDLLLGLLKQALTRRDDLKVVIMSATIDADLFQEYFPQSVVKTVSGRQHKVTVKYLEQPVLEVIPAVIETILRIHIMERGGDILVFASGVAEIDAIIWGVEAALSDEEGSRFKPAEVGALGCYALHSKMAPEEQDIAVHARPPPVQNGKRGRKVIVSTNIAETSITIPGITHVVDPFEEKVNMWNPRTECWSLRAQPISKAASGQRRGRAGRKYEGTAWVFCTERGYWEDTVEHTVAPVLQGDMVSESLAIMKTRSSPVEFDFIVPPAPESIVTALDILQKLGAVDRNGTLLPRGEKITSIPIDAYSAVTILQSTKYGCSDEIITILSMMDASLCGSHLWLRARGREQKEKLDKAKGHFQHPSGVHITLLHIYREWRQAYETGSQDSFLFDNMLHGSVLAAAHDIRMQLLGVMTNLSKSNRSDPERWMPCEQHPDSSAYHTKILQALAAGNFLRVAKRVSSAFPRQYQLVRGGMNVSLAPNVHLGSANEHNEWVFYAECYEDNRRGAMIRGVSSITPEIMVSAQPGYWWDAQFVPEGHIKEGLLQVLARMMGSDALRPRGMPASPVGEWPEVESCDFAGLTNWIVACEETDSGFLQKTLPAWQQERAHRHKMAVSKLSQWKLGAALDAKFDDGSSRYSNSPRVYYDLNKTIMQIDAAKFQWKLASS